MSSSEDNAIQSASYDDEEDRASGAKRPLKDDDDKQVLSEKKLRRLEKNRISARECRRRKREATENIQRQINLLEGENLRLRLQLQIGEEAEESMLREQQKVTQEIDDLLKSGASESEVFAQLEDFKEKHADYGKSRRSAIEFHLRNIERLLMPTQTTSIAMMAIQNVPHPPSSADNKEEQHMKEAPVASVAAAAPPVPSSEETSSSKALFQHLVQYLEVSPEQAVALKDSRFVAQDMDDCLAKALKVLDELRERIAQTGEDLETEFDQVRQILTPTQAAKFLIWVANNKACIHMLNELWDRVYDSGAGSSGSTA